MYLNEKSDALAAESSRSVEVFYSYAPEDERWQKELEKQLSGLKRKGLIVDWHKRRISAGMEKVGEIDAHLNTAAIILLLVSPDFIASDYCYGIEMKRAMERHERGEARVIPIILRPTDWRETPFDKLQALPTNDKPITKWSNRDNAFLDVVKGIREAVETLNLQKSKNQRIEKNLTPSSIKRYDVALSYASEDRASAESLAQALRQRGVKVFYDRYEKAALWGQNLYTYLSDLYQNQALYSVLFLSQHYASKLWTSHERKAAQARALKEQGEYILPIRLDDTEIPGLLPTVAYLSWPPETAESIADAVVEKLRSQKTSEQWLEEGNRYCQIDWYNEALVAYERAIHLNPKNAGAYNNKSWALNQLERYEEALIASEQALHLDPHLNAAHANKQIALTGMEDQKKLK
jgi:tetratricopeptide (TPR) repeat protein